MNVRQVIPRDAIPSIDDPTFASEYFGSDDEEVIVLDGMHVETGNGSSEPARAYPVRVLNYHEVANDRFDERPVAVTWCPLCASAVVYDRRVEGRTLTFGVSGKLADDDLVLYDRETGSEWKQSSGICIAGDFEGKRLAHLPAAVTTWRGFRESYPEGRVLTPPGGKSEAASEDTAPKTIEYDLEPYEAYFEGEGFGLAAHRGDGSREWEREDISPKTVVLGIERGDEALGFPLPRVEAAGGVVEAGVDGYPVVVFATPDGIHAFDRREGGGDGGESEEGEAGEAVEGFESTDDPHTFRADGTRWDGATGKGEDGRRLERIPAKRLFAFAWQDDHGPGNFYSSGEREENTHDEREARDRN